MATTRYTSADHDVDLMYKQFAEADLQPLWEMPGLLSALPQPSAVPFVWRFNDLAPIAARAGELVGIDRGGDRRVLACCNPGLDGAPYAVGTLWAAVQYLQPGEVAPAHRHSPAALRFVLEGDGVWTVVDGDPIPMAAGDLVITPSWTFHEHHNSGSAPMMWLDVLDVPVVRALDAMFYEDGPSDDVVVSTPRSSHSERIYGGGAGLLPVSAGAPAHPRHSPLLAYRWADTDRALAQQLADGATHAHVRYADPTTGRDVMPTMRCEIQRVPAGCTVPAQRQTGNRVASLLHGSGTAVIGEQSFQVGAGDILAVPSWAPLTIRAHQELDLFLTSDAPILEALGLYRERSDG